MPTTPAPALPYPAASNAPDVPYWMQQLAESASAALAGRLEMTSTGAGIDGQTKPAGTPWRVKVAQSAAATTDAAARHRVTFPTPFTGGLFAVVAMTSAGTPKAAVLNGSYAHSKASFEVVLDGAPSTAGVRVMYLAVGW